MKTMLELKQKGYTETKTIHKYIDEGIEYKKPNLYVFFGSVAKAGETKNSIKHNSPKNSIWVTGRFLEIGDDKALEEFRHYADKKFNENFSKRWELLNKEVTQ